MEQGKSSIKRYVLIAAVVAIWAIVIYKIIDVIKSEENQAIDIPYIQKKIQEKSKKEKDYTLLLSYSDPFLKESGSTATAIEAVSAPPPAMAMWPQVRYSGYLKNGKNMVGVLEVNGSHQSVKKGDIVGSIKVVEVYEDSIRLKHEGELKTFIR